MSLINDALKRASEAKPPPDAEVSAPALRPVEERPRSVGYWVWCAVGLTCAAFLASLAITMGLLAGLSEHQLKESQAVSAREIKAEANSVPVPELPAGARTIQSAPRNSATNADKIARAPAQPVPEEHAGANTNRDAAVNASTNPVASAAVGPPKPAAPVLKLQGILWKPSKPLVMMNGKLVGRGEKILNAKVVAIDRESVTLNKDGETVVLTLP